MQYVESVRHEERDRPVDPLHLNMNDHGRVQRLGHRVTGSPHNTIYAADRVAGTARGYGHLQSRYVQVVAAIVMDMLIGRLLSEMGEALKPLVVGIIKMIIAPIIICTALVD